MREFFASRRRKLGCAMFTLAMLVLFLLIRSHRHIDCATYKLAPDFECAIEIRGGRFVWSRSRSSAIGKKRSVFDGFTWKTTPFVEFRTSDGFNYSSQMFLLGAELAEYEDLFAQPGETIRGVTTRVRYWRISLLWLVIPLTLVSAGLILPRSEVNEFFAI